MEKSPTPKPIVSTSTWFILIALLLLGFIAAVLAEAARDWLPAVDGPYQTINACRKILAGQAPGSDFRVFHGLIPPWYHSIFYALLGGTIAGSVAAYTAACLSVIWLPGALAGISSGLGQRNAILLSLLAVHGLLLIPPPVYDAVFPGGNMLGTRIALALAPAIGLFVFLSKKNLRNYKAGLIAGVAPALGLLVSQEQGMAIGAATLATALIALSKIKNFTFREFLLGGFAAAISFFSVYFFGVFTLTAGQPAPYLNFAWSAIPENQFWFFGKPPKAVIQLADLLDFKELLFPASCGLAFWLIALGGGFVYRRWQDNQTRLSPWANYLLIFLACYSIASLHPLAGYKGQHYFAPTIHAGMVACLVCLGPAILQLMKWLRPPKATALIVVFATTCLALQSFKNQIRPLVTGKRAEPAHYIAAEAPNLLRSLPDSIGEQARVEYFTQIIGSNGRLWSTFGGPEEEMINQLHPSPYDYIIYALTEADEADYLREFKQFSPTHVVTGREASGHIYQWMMKRYWPIYRTIGEHYQPLSAINSRVLWQRRQLPLPDISPTPIPHNTHRSLSTHISFELAEQPETTQVFEIKLRYRLKNNPTPLLSRRLTRIAVRAKGVPHWREISIRTKQSDEWTEFSLPVMLNQPTHAQISLTPLSPFGAPRLEVQTTEVHHLKNFPADSASLLFNEKLLTQDTPP